MLRNPIVACFGLFLGVAAVACATSAAPDIADIIAERNATDPADAGGSTVVSETDTSSTDTSSTGPTTPVATVTKPVAPPPVVFDAGGARGADAGGGGGGGGDDDDTTGGGKNCPDTDLYEAEALAASFGGGATSCSKSASECASDECCVVNAISSTANLCVPK